MIMLEGAKLAIYGLFLNYYCYYVMKGTFIPHGTPIFLTLAFICILFSIIAYDEGQIYIWKECTLWGLYGLIALSTSLVFSEMDTNALMVDIIKYFQRLLLIMFIAYICEKEKSIHFGLRLLIMTALGCSFAVFRTLGDYQLKLDVTSGANLSANDIGALMAFGIISILIYGGNKSRKNPTIVVAAKVAAVIVCFCIIFLAGSRKSMYSVLIFLILIFILCGFDYFRDLSPLRLFMIILILAAAGYFIYVYLWQYVEDTNLYVRILGRGAEAAAESDESRWNLYMWGLKEFIRNPLVGVGYNNFVNLYGNYTHSTYMEPITCSGMIGFIYLAPYVKMFINQFKIIRAYPINSHERTWEKGIIAFFIAFAFIGVGIPFMYKDIPCILLGIFLASQQISIMDITSEQRRVNNYE